jgi:hypothetical protein
MIRLLRKYQWIPAKGETWMEHRAKLLALQHPLTPQPEPEPDEEPEDEAPELEPVLSAADRQALRRKFRIPRGQPDPAWFDTIEIV